MCSAELTVVYFLGAALVVVGLVAFVAIRHARETERRLACWRSGQWDDDEPHGEVVGGYRPRQRGA